MELLTASLQEKQPMEKEVAMEAWLLDEAVEHIQKSIDDLPNSAHRPNLNHCPAIDTDSTVIVWNMHSRVCTVELTVKDKAKPLCVCML